MAAMDAAQVAAKWKRNLVSSVPTIKAGVEAVTQSPMEKAAARSDAYLAGVQQAVETGKWAEGLRSVTLEQWKKAFLDKGVQRIAAGAETASPKVENFMRQLLPYTAALKTRIAAMPKGNIEDSIARATAAIRAMAEFKYRRRGG